MMRMKTVLGTMLSATLACGGGAAFAQSTDSTAKPGDSAARPEQPKDSTAAPPQTTAPSGATTMPHRSDGTTVTTPAKSGDTKMSRDQAGSADADKQNTVKLAQESLEAIERAQKALEGGDTKAAKGALKMAEAHLQPLYDTPPLASLTNEIDEAIATIRADGTGAVKPVDLAPLMGIVTRERAYMEPEAYADLAQAQKYARDEKLDAAAERLQRARDRITASVAYLPVQEAYLRVLAAQTLIENGHVDQAKQMLVSLPVVLLDVQATTPLVRARFDLQAAAAALQEKNWTRAAELLTTARTRLDGLAGSGAAGAERIRSLVDEIDRLQKRATSQGNQPKPQEVRDLAKRVKNSKLG